MIGGDGKMIPFNIPPYTGDEAQYIKKAIEINPHDDRLKENQKFILKLIKTQ